MNKVTYEIYYSGGYYKVVRSQHTEFSVYSHEVQSFLTLQEALNYIQSMGYENSNHHSFGIKIV